MNNSVHLFFMEDEVNIDAYQVRKVVSNILKERNITVDALNKYLKKQREVFREMGLQKITTRRQVGYIKFKIIDRELFLISKLKYGL